MEKTKKLNYRNGKDKNRANSIQYIEYYYGTKSDAKLFVESIGFNKLSELPSIAYKNIWNYRIDWKESYIIIKLLGNKIIILGNEVIKNVLYPIIKILRTESNRNFEYSIKDDIVIISQQEEILRVPIVEFKQKATSLLNAINSNKDRAFSIPEIKEFMISLKCFSLKASSSSKTDITIVVHDKITNQKPVLGFSIKSQLGSPSTLLNAGKTTNFIYKLNENFDNETLNHINSLVVKRGKKKHADVKGRVKEISKKGFTLSFDKTENKIFHNNLTLIDSRLPELLSHIVLDFYSNSSSSLESLIELSKLKNPLNFDLENNHEFYDYKLKHFFN